MIETNWCRLVMCLGCPHDTLGGTSQPRVFFESEDAEAYIKRHIIETSRRGVQHRVVTLHAIISNSPNDVE